MARSQVSSAVSALSASRPFNTDCARVSPPQRNVFVDVTLRAIRSWRFRPMIRDGERLEVVHELTVYYRLNQT